MYHSQGLYNQAVQTHQEALVIHREVGDRAGQGTTLSNIGGVYKSTGQPEQALEYFGKALLIMEEVGDRAGGKVTRFNMAAIYLEQRNLEEAVSQLRRVVELAELVQSPDLELEIRSRTVGKFRCWGLSL